MKPIYTLLMVLVFAGLGGYVYLNERQPLEPAASNGEKPKVMILNLDKSKLTSIEVDQNMPSQSVALELKGKDWVFADKSAAKVDSTRIESLINQLERWQAADVLEEKFKPAQAADFGLEPADLIVRLNKGDLGTFKIGNKTPTSSGYYVLKEGDPRLYLAYVNQPEEFKKLINEPPVAKASPVASPAK